MCEIWWRVFSVGVQKSGVIRYRYDAASRLDDTVHLVIYTRGLKLQQ